MAERRRSSVVIVLQGAAAVSMMFQDGTPPGAAFGIYFRGTSSAVDASGSESGFLSLSGAKLKSHASTVRALQVTSSAASDCQTTASPAQDKDSSSELLPYRATSART